MYSSFEVDVDQLSSSLQPLNDEDQDTFTALPPSNTTTTNNTNNDVSLPMITKERSRASLIPGPNGQVNTDSHGLTLSWHNLSYDVTGLVDKKKTRIIHNLTGAVHPSEIIAIMGPSGGGKTTLMNVLSGRHLNGDVNGEILLNGHFRTKNFRRQSCYVEQDDHLFPNLTVREMIQFSALLRLSKDYTKEEKIQRGEDVLREMGLTSCANTLIGNAQRRGVSGGERKRCSVAIELITNPRLLFLDEPTSGLDSTTAFKLVESLQMLARSGRAVICTIHQPQAKTFALFDKLVLLSKGRICYYGPTNRVDNYFANMGMPCPPQSNVADHILDMTIVDTRSDAAVEATTARLEMFSETFKASVFAAEAEAESNVILATPNKEETSANSLVQWSVPWVEEVSILTRRAWLNTIRDPRMVKAALFQAIILGLIVGFLFFRLGHDQDAVHDRYSVLFFLMLNQSFSIASSGAALFHQEKATITRERNAGAYRVSSYYLGRTIAELPVIIAVPTIHVLLVYWLVGLNQKASAFFIFLLVYNLTVITAQSYGILVSAVTPTFEVASIVVPITMIVLMLFGGFYLNNRSIWVGFIWIQALSFIKYGYTALAVNEFTDTTWTCST